MAATRREIRIEAADRGKALDFGANLPDWEDVRAALLALLDDEPEALEEPGRSVEVFAFDEPYGRLLERLAAGCAALREPVWRALRDRSALSAVAPPDFAALPFVELLGWAEVGFHLAQVIDGAFWLARDDLAEAWRRLAAAAGRRAAESEPAPIGLAGFFAESFVDCVFDAEGNLVWLGQGGDCWVMDWLELIADLVRPGSWFLLRDDAGRYWKTLFEDGRMRCFGPPGADRA